MEDEDGNSYDPFGGMQLIFTADGADEDSIDWNLAIAAGGATLGSVSLTGGNGGESLAAVDVASLTDVYDFSNDDEVEAYTASMNMDAITENLTSAGMPEGWLDDVIAATGDSDIGEYGDRWCCWSPKSRQIWLEIHWMTVGTGSLISNLCEQAAA